jgi:hypothetical protein
MPATPGADPLRVLLARLKGVKQHGNSWRACCPAHDDSQPSLSIGLSSNGDTILVKCHAGCDTSAVLSAVRMELKELFRGAWLQPPRPNPGSGPQPSCSGGPGRIVATYDYTDQSGRLLFQVVRFQPKRFRQRRPDGHGGWLWNLDGVARPLYRLSDLDKAGKEQWIFVVEGEKDADRLAAQGLTATTNPGGAGKWRAEHTATLVGRKVVILCDNDAVGQSHGQGIARDLARANRDAATPGVVRVGTPPNLPPKGDISDWLDAGGSREQLLTMVVIFPVVEVENVPNVPVPVPVPEGAPTSGTGRGTGMGTETKSSDTSPLSTRLADVPARGLSWLWPGRLARGKVAILDGDPGLGKSLVTLDLAARISSGRPLPDQSTALAPPANVLIVNCEDGVADTIRPRLEAMDADLTRIQILHGPTVQGHEFLPGFPRDLHRLERAIKETSAALVVIDPIMAFLDETICTGNDQSVRQALSPLANLGERTGAVILLVRHLNKTGGAKAVYRGGGSIGIIGACRSAWLIGRHPSDDRQRVLAQIKNNLAKPQPSLGYELVSDEHGRPQVAWLGTVDIAADELVGAAALAAELPELERAAALLKDALANGPRPVQEIVADLAKHRISRRTLARAKNEIGVESILEKTATGCRALWQLGEPLAPKLDDPNLDLVRSSLR